MTDMALPASPQATLPDQQGLKAKLRRAERMKKLRAFGLVAPLLLFILVTFVVPIADMLRRSANDVELSEVWPQTTQAIAQWTDHSKVPPEAVFATLANEIRSSFAEKTLPTAARRLNYAVDNGRSLVFGTARKLPASSDNWTATLSEIDARWADVETWQAISQASGPVTSFFLLQAVDLHQNANGDIVGVDENSAIYVDVLVRTFTIAFAVTGLAVLLGFPVAYLLATLPPKSANLLMIMVLLPFWTSLLVRTAAWVVLLQEHGLINDTMVWLGLIDEPVRLIYNRIGVYIAMTHVLLPFMIMPMYAVMKGIKPHFMRAAVSLGARPTTAFIRIYLPMTLPGIAAGALLVFIMALGYYVTPALIGGAADQMISYFIAFYTSGSVNWGLASALGAVLLAVTLVLYTIYNRLVGISNIKLG